MVIGIELGVEGCNRCEICIRYSVRCRSGRSSSSVESSILGVVGVVVGGSSRTT